MEKIRKEDKAKLKNLDKKMEKPQLSDYEVMKEKELNEKVLKSIVNMYQICRDYTDKFYESTQQKLYFTPTMFIRIFGNY
jgi:hypothetical protein